MAKSRNVPSAPPANKITPLRSGAPAGRGPGPNSTPAQVKQNLADSQARTAAQEAIGRELTGAPVLGGPGTK